MAEKIVFSPTDVVASINQTLEFAYGTLHVEGEISNFKISKNKWVYFDIKDELASIRCFGTVYQLPGPLEDGLVVHISASARLHQQFGFSLNLSSIRPVGEGALRRAADLLQAKLSAEGLFAPERKRSLPSLPEKIGLITSGESAAYSDFIKVTNERWRGLYIQLADVQVQGESAPLQIVAAVQYFNETAEPPDVIVMTRGGGSADDLATFDDERVVRAVAGSRVPILVAIGHEVDISLAELAADQRASTPSNAAQILLPDRHYILGALHERTIYISSLITETIQQRKSDNKQLVNQIDTAIKQHMATVRSELHKHQQLVVLLDPKTILKRGYALIRGSTGRLIVSSKDVAAGDRLKLELKDGTIPAIVQKAGS